MIKTFADKNTKEFWDTGKSQRTPPSNLRKAAKKKLAMLHSAGKLEDLRIPPGNRLEGCVMIGPASIAFESTINSAGALSDGTAMPSM